MKYTKGEVIGSSWKLKKGLYVDWCEDTLDITELLKKVVELVTKQDVMGALKDCYDPEIPISIVDLGLIYDVKIEGKKVSVKMTLTARGCPMHSFIANNAKQRVMELKGVDDVDVEVVWDPPWTPERMSKEAKKLLGFNK